MARFLAIWFRHLTTDYFSRKLSDPARPFVFAALSHNRKIITAVSPAATAAGIHKGMAVADARVLVPALDVFSEQEGLEDKLLLKIGQWCLRYTPLVALDTPDGLILDISGCTHLWGGERPYFREIITKITGKGFTCRGAIADTAGAAWAWARYGVRTPILAEGTHREALRPLPAPALRLEKETLSALRKLGLTTIGIILQQPRDFLTPRFDKTLVLRLDQALGDRNEPFIPIAEPVAYQERLACLDPIATRGGIEIALTRLLEQLGRRLQQDGKGLRQAVLTCYRLDGEQQAIPIGTTRPTYNINHLFRLFELKLDQVAPGLGIEVFTLDAPLVEEATSRQECLWGATEGVDSIGFAELLDRLSNKGGVEQITRFLPSEHHWPERAIQPAKSLKDMPASPWPEDSQVPFHLFETPERIEVMAPIPDYPPKFFRWKGKEHKITRADGPKRNEEEWWIERRLHRDYYAVEDDKGNRYWLFRAGHYGQANAAWFIHGIFA